MKESKKDMKIGLMLASLFTFVTASPVLAASADVLTSNKTGTQDGFDYELWRDKGDASMTLKEGGTFDCFWDKENTGNVLFRKGKKFDKTKTHDELGTISLSYGCDYKPDGNSYLCVYGWSVDPLVEFYVVEAWGSWRPPGAVSKGKVEIDGGTYDIYETTRTNQPSIQGNATFQQYWSVRTDKKTSGTVSISEHFKAWEEKGMTLGKMYEVAFCVEGYQSSGTANVYSHALTIGDATIGTVSLPPSAVEASTPTETAVPDEAVETDISDATHASVPRAGIGSYILITTGVIIAAVCGFFIFARKIRKK